MNKWKACVPLGNHANSTQNQESSARITIYMTQRVTTKRRNNEGVFKSLSTSAQAEIAWTLYSILL